MQTFSTLLLPTGKKIQVGIDRMGQNKMEKNISWRFPSLF